MLTKRKLYECTGVTVVLLKVKLLWDVTLCRRMLHDLSKRREQHTQQHAVTSQKSRIFILKLCCNFTRLTHSGIHTTALTYKPRKVGSSRQCHRGFRSSGTWRRFVWYVVLGRPRQPESSLKFCILPTHKILRISSEYFPQQINCFVSDWFDV